MLLYHYFPSITFAYIFFPISCFQAVTCQLYWKMLGWGRMSDAGSQNWKWRADVTSWGHPHEYSHLSLLLKINPSPTNCIVLSWISFQGLEFGNVYLLTTAVGRTTQNSLFFVGVAAKKNMHFHLNYIKCFKFTSMHRNKDTVFMWIHPL